jgi:hypothetical protein
MLPSTCENGDDLFRANYRYLVGLIVQSETGANLSTSFGFGGWLPGDIASYTETIHPAP